MEVIIIKTVIVVKTYRSKAKRFKNNTERHKKYFLTEIEFELLGN